MMRRTRVSGRGWSTPVAATADALWRRAILARCWRHGKGCVSFGCCLPWDAGPDSLQVWKASSTAGWIECDAGGSSSRQRLGCAGSPVCQDCDGRWSAGGQTDGSGFPRRDAAEGQARRRLMNHRRGHWNRWRERAVLQRSVLHGRSGFAGDWVAVWSTAEDCGGPLQQRVDSWRQRQAERTIWTGPAVLMWGGSAVRSRGGGNWPSRQTKGRGRSQ